MLYQILMIIAMLVMALGILLVTLVRQKQPRLSTKYWDFISIGAIFFGGFALINLLYGTAGMKPELNDTVTKVLMIVFPILLVVFFIAHVAFFFWKGGANSRVTEDERTEINGTKSARNALLATNIALFAYLLNSETLTRSALIVVLFSGYVIYVFSTLFNYYFKA